MADRVGEIMDATERRVRSGGYNGFSFRDIAADVGVKSASVHYHFPTKGALAAAVARRYLARLEESYAARRAEGVAPVAAMKSVFSAALAFDGAMCLCGVLGTESGALPPEVQVETRRFFERCIALLGQDGVAEDAALSAMATLEGGMLLARVLGTADVFDRATAELGR